jgi:GDP-4-dehydro-6-deoxy-D-mannose reductase
MKALITGCDGFIASHLAEFLIGKSYDVYGSYLKKPSNPEVLKDVTLIKCDIKEKNSVSKMIRDSKPDFIFHLAAQSLVVPSWKDPIGTFETNIVGTTNILEVAKNSVPNSKIFVACSAAEYGLNFKHEIPVREDKEFRPASPYAVSKIGADMVSYLYHRTYAMNIIRGRFFNITGPRKVFDACSDFARAIAGAEKGKEKSVKVGNLEGIRDITDVRDAVKAVLLLVKKGKFGEPYNICSGKGYKMEYILNTLISLSTENIVIKKDKSKMRPLEDPIFIGDNSKIRKLGWGPEIPIEKTLKDTLDYWRSVA